MEDLLVGFLCYTKTQNYIQGKGKQRMIKILLMEDDLNLCQSIQQALKKEGYSVDCCNDGESAMIICIKY